MFKNNPGSWNDDYSFYKKLKQKFFVNNWENCLTVLIGSLRSCIRIFVNFFRLHNCSSNLATFIWASCNWAFTFASLLALASLFLAIISLSSCTNPFLGTTSNPLYKSICKELLFTFLLSSASGNLIRGPEAEVVSECTSSSDGCKFHRILFLNGS